MVTGNFKMAVDSIRQARARSLLTMLGVIIGVVSVVTIVSIGEGVKNQIREGSEKAGNSLITVRPGNTVTRNDSGAVTGVNIPAILAGSALSEKDWQAVAGLQSVKSAIPLSYVNGIARIDNREFREGAIFATSEKLPAALNQEIQYGSFFNDDDSGKQVAVIGKRVAEKLFKENIPIGRSFEIRNQSFIVRGVFEEFDTPPLSIDADYNSAIFIPYKVGKSIDSVGAIQQLLVLPKDKISADTLATDVRAQLNAVHGGSGDFSVLKQEDALAATTSVLDILTRFMTGIAAISLVVGGIGIMNIMLVSVSERTREIGLRKAIGATNQQILSQFVIESAVLSLAGGIIGVIGSLLANYFIRLLTEFQPAVSLPVMGGALVISLVVGVVFGTAPALKAARKDPIEALRQGT